MTLSEAREQLKVQNYVELESKIEKVAEESIEPSVEIGRVVSHASVENAGVNEETGTHAHRPGSPDLHCGTGW